MDLDAFKATFEQDQPPKSWPPTLQSLWYDGKDNWHDAHEIAQDIPGSAGAWIHAYLHRKEGDLWNADYWYRQAGKKRPDKSLSDEWSAMVEYFLSNL